MTELYDGDSEESRDAFRAYDENEPVFRRSAWQIWRDACAWQASSATTANHIGGIDEALVDLFDSAQNDKIGQDAFVSRVRALFAGDIDVQICHKCYFAFNACDVQRAALNDVIGERKRQDAEWGGPATDDKNSFDDWARFITKQIQSVKFDNVETIRRPYVKIAALALAAIESIDRKVAKP